MEVGIVKGMHHHVEPFHKGGTTVGGREGD